MAWFLVNGSYWFLNCLFFFNHVLPVFKVRLLRTIFLTFFMNQAYKALIRIIGLKFRVVISFALISSVSAFSQTDHDSIRSQSLNQAKRIPILALGEGVFLVSSHMAFKHMWYAGFEKSRFHLFNDVGEWKGIDKFGHAFGTYQLSRVNTKAFMWAGASHRKSVWLGSMYSFLFVSSIELLDGYSKEWGASLWDLAANVGGMSLFMAQELTIQKQLVSLKYSYYPDKYRSYRPSVLGKNFGESLIKDYNSTKFWLSFDIHQLVHPAIPKWLNIAVGYGATGMTGGFENHYSDACQCKPVPDSKRANEYYLSADIDFTKIKTSSKFLKGLFFTLNSFKFPAPALKYSSRKWQLCIR
jgi:hypothetical protein